MHRRLLLDLLDRHEARHPEDLLRTDHVRHFARLHADAFERSCRVGHVTASAFILDPRRERFLLHHHRKLDRWLQLGGHADGDPHPARVAWTEAREESGIDDFAFLFPRDGLRPLDVDAHVIPATPKEGAHLHHDLRFLLQAGSDVLARREAESKDLRWFPLEDLEAVVEEESLLRMGRRARAWLREGVRPLSPEDTFARLAASAGRAAADEDAAASPTAS